MLLAAERWAHLWTNQRIVFYCDNLGCVHCINSGKAEHPDAVDILQRLFWISVTHNCEFKAVHISSSDNYFADALSRMHCSSFLDKYALSLL